MKNVFLIISLFFFLKSNFAQEKTEWFPAEMNIQPFTANFLEPKAGFLFSLGQNQLRLDISTSRDIIHWNSDDETISIGADLFTFTRLRSEDNFKFPVETIDYLFGLNAGYKKTLNQKNEIGFRFRFSHISAHLVDGSFDNNTGIWRDGRNPFVYSKEFLEIFPYYKINTLRVYLGFTYIFHIVPEEIKKGIYQAGFDYFATFIGSESITPFAAYDFKLTGIQSYSGNNTFSAGVKLGKWNSRGFSVYFSYISGKSIHGLYYDLNESYSNIGFNFEL